MVELLLSHFLPEDGKTEAKLKREGESEGGEVIPSIIATSWTQAISLHPHQLLIRGIERQIHCLLP